MTYRSDQDAALARADALQVDLDRSHRELERAKALLARREAELATERARKAPALPDEPAAPARSGAHPAVAIGMVAFAFAGIAAFVTCSQAQHQRDREEQDKAFRRSLAHADLGADVFRSCTVHTIPSGAEVVSVDGAGVTYPMGYTPFTRSIGSWGIAGEHLEARAEGYRPVTLTQPETDGKTGDCAQTITLEPLSAR